MKNYIALALFALAGSAAAEGTLTCPNGLLSFCQAPPNSCTCDFLKQVTCVAPTTLTCNSFCTCV